MIQIRDRNVLIWHNKASLIADEVWQDSRVLWLYCKGYFVDIFASDSDAAYDIAKNLMKQVYR